MIKNPLKADVFPIRRCLNQAHKKRQPAIRGYPFIFAPMRKITAPPDYVVPLFHKNPRQSMIPLRFSLTRDVIEGIEDPDLHGNEEA